MTCRGPRVSHARVLSLRPNQWRSGDSRENKWKRAAAPSETRDVVILYRTSKCLRESVPFEPTWFKTKKKELF
jgi:hypothetical protein